MDWYIYFKNDALDNVRLATSPEEARAKLARRHKTSWEDLESQGYACLLDQDVPQELWEKTFRQLKIKR